MGTEERYIKQFRRVLRDEPVQQDLLREADRDLIFNHWKDPRGSQNIPVMANALFKDSKSFDWIRKYLTYNLKTSFLDYEGPVSRMKTPWIVASLAYMYEDMDTSLQKLTTKFLDTLFLFLSLMSIPMNRVDYRRGPAIICAGPRSPKSVWIDHPLNSMLSYCLGPTTSINRHEGQGLYWSSGIFRHFNGLDMLTEEAVNLMSLITYNPLLLEKEEAREIRRYLQRINLRGETSYIIMRYNHGVFSAYPNNRNVHGHPIQVARAHKSFSDFGELTWYYLNYPSLDTVNKKSSLGGEIRVSKRFDHTEVRSFYPNQPELVFAVPRDEALIYTMLINEHDFLFSLGE